MGGTEMSELQKIKSRIFQDDRVEEVLELLDCWNISTEQSGRLYVAGLPDGDNERSVQIKNNESLSANIRSKRISGDIYNIVGHIVFDAKDDEACKKILHKIKYWLCSKLKYPEYIDDFYRATSSNTEVPKFNQWLKKVGKKQTVNEVKNETLCTSVLNDYEVIPYLKWYREGLSINTQKHFQVSIDVSSDRVTFPIHNKHGELVGIKGRYCGNDRSIEEKYKYLYLVPCNKSIELFNFHRALPHIMERKEVIIVEGGKSTMFLHQWKYPNSVSMEGDSLSDIQVKLLKELGLNIKYIFAYDKDKDAEHVKKEAEKLTGRLKYGILDTSNLLSDKDSPVDKGEGVWNALYHNNLYKIN